MQSIRRYLPLVVLLLVAAYLISPVLAAQEGPAPAPDEALEQEVAELKERVAALERLVGQERESRPSVVLRLRALEIDVDELERAADRGEGEERGDDRAVRDLTRRLQAAETRLERLDRNRFPTLERQINAIERQMRSLETRVRRLE